MIKKNLCVKIYVVFISIVVSSCSAPTAIDQAPKKYRVELPDMLSEELTVSVEATTVKKSDLVPSASLIKPIVSTARKVEVPILSKSKLTERLIRLNPQLMPPRSKFSYRLNHLKGDYSDNLYANQFISMMVSKHGFSRSHLNYIFSNVKRTPFLSRMAYKDAFDSKKKERKKPRSGKWNRYRDNFLTQRMINRGVKFWHENRISLQRVEQHYGVPQEYILGIIGVETRYGDNVGKNRAIDALSAMGFENPRRGKYFRSELESYLLMTRKARLDPLKPLSSYAGALGLGQFMPSNIAKFGVDQDRNGSVNLWSSPDAIASIANYFQKHGWRNGGTVAVKVRPSNRRYRSLKTGFKSSHSLDHLRNRGIPIHRIGNISGKASLLKLDTYSGDEVWLGGHNFYVISRYNHSTYYAMAVHQLAQALKQRISSNHLLRQASLN